MKSLARLTALASLIPLLASCETKPAMNVPAAATPAPEIPKGAEIATLGAGCFWCVEAACQQLPGVVSATSGSMGGHIENPSYEQICTGKSGHAEVVRIVFDPKTISYGEILAWFWKLHDPTTPDRQGNDVGPQYRSVIFFHSPEQKRTAEASKQAAAADFPDPIVTEISKATAFWPAGADHQNYYFQNKSRNPYCRLVIEPKLKKLKLGH